MSISFIFSDPPEDEKRGDVDKMIPATEYRATERKITITPSSWENLQAEFEREDIYEDLKRQEERKDFSKMPAAAAEALKAEFAEKRFIVSYSVLNCVSHEFVLGCFCSVLFFVCFLLLVQWVPRLDSAQDKRVRDLRAIKSACPASTKSFVFPTRDESNECLVERACFGLSRGALKLRRPLLS